MNDNTCRVGMSNRAWEQVNTYELHIREFAKFLDNMPAKFGTGDDFQIVQNGTSAFIDNHNQGHIYIRNNDGSDFGGNIYIQALSGEDSINVIHDGAVELYHNGNKKLETTSSGINVTGQVLGDSARFEDDGSGSPILGVLTDDESPWAFVINNSTSSNDYANGFKWYVNNSGNGIHQFRGASAYKQMSFTMSNGSTSQNVMVFDTNRAVGLYYQGNQKLITTNTGITISGSIVIGTVTLSGGGVQIQDADKFIAGTGDDLQIYHDGSASNIRNTNESVRLDIRSDVVHISDNDNNHDMARFNYQGSVQLYHNYNEKFATTANGIDVTGRIDINDSNTQIGEGGTNSVRVTTNSGYVDIGPMNTTFCHFQTDRALFYFNKRTQFNGHVEPYLSLIHI